jgi:hypothetical protein
VAAESPRSIQEQSTATGLKRQPKLQSINRARLDFNRPRRSSTGTGVASALMGTRYRTCSRVPMASARNSSFWRGPAQNRTRLGRPSTCFFRSIDPRLHVDDEVNRFLPDGDVIVLSKGFVCTICRQHCRFR